VNERGLETRSCSTTRTNVWPGAGNLQPPAQAEVTTGSKVGFLSTLKDNLSDMEYDTQDETTRCRRRYRPDCDRSVRREILYEMSLSRGRPDHEQSLLTSSRDPPAMSPGS